MSALRTILIFIIGFGATLSSAQMTRELSSCELRQAPGIICQSCELVATCLKYNSIWTTVPVDTCDNAAGKFCNAKLGACSSDPGPCNPSGYEGNFACTSEGVFPDPYDCQQYHVCNTAVGTIVATTTECDGDKAFNIATEDCTLSVDSPICKANQFSCDNAGDIRPWPGSDKIFYICKSTGPATSRSLFPSLYRCGPDEVFDKYMCVKNDRTEIIGGISDDKCTTQGLFPDSADCRQYFRCAKVGSKPFKHTCPRNSYFSSVASACVWGTCDNTF